MILIPFTLGPLSAVTHCSVIVMWLLIYLCFYFSYLKYLLYKCRCNKLSLVLRFWLVLVCGYYVCCLFFFFFVLFFFGPQHGPKLHDKLVARVVFVFKLNLVSRSYQGLCTTVLQTIPPHTYKGHTLDVKEVRLEPEKAGVSVGKGKGRGKINKIK